MSWTILDASKACKLAKKLREYKVASSAPNYPVHPDICDEAADLLERMVNLRLDACKLTELDFADGTITIKVPEVALEKGFNAGHVFCDFSDVQQLANQKENPE